MTDTPVVVAQGGILDLDAVMNIMDDSFDPSYGEAWTAPQCASLMALPGVWLSIARLGDDPAGFALARVIADEAELLLLAVKSSAQRRGIGALLLDGFREEAIRRGATRLHLEVRDGNPAANLYAIAGYTVIGRRKNYYNGRDGQIYDALTLARRA